MNGHVRQVWGRDFPSTTARNVALVLADHANTDDIAWPSVGRIAWALGVTERTAKRGLAELREAGAVISEVRPGSSTRYKLAFENLPEKKPHREAPVSETGGDTAVTPAPQGGDTAVTPQAPGGDTGVTPGVTLPSPRSTNEERKKNKNTSRDSTDSEPGWSLESRQEFEAFFPGTDPESNPPDELRDEADALVARIARDGPSIEMAAMDFYARQWRSRVSRGEREAFRDLAIELHEQHGMAWDEIKERWEQWRADMRVRDEWKFITPNRAPDRFEDWIIQQKSSPSGDSEVYRIKF